VVIMKATSVSPWSGQQAASSGAVVFLHGHQLDRNLARAVTAEAAGTFVLVLAITSAAVAATLARPVAGAPYGSLAVHAAVEHHRADHLLRSGVEDLAQRPQGDLGDDTLIDLPYLGDGPGRWLDGLAGLDMTECLVLRDDIDRGQVPLDSQ
jgi:hypothetical protein